MEIKAPQQKKIHLYFFGMIVMNLCWIGISFFTSAFALLACITSFRHMRLHQWSFLSSFPSAINRITLFFIEYTLTKRFWDFFFVEDEKFETLFYAQYVMIDFFFFFSHSIRTLYTLTIRS